MGNNGDTDVVRRCLDGDLDAFGVIVDRYGGRLVNLAYHMIGDRHEAEDVAQDAFLRAYRALRSFRRRARFSSWLYRIALNACKDRLKARSRQGMGVEPDSLEALGRPPDGSVVGDAAQSELSEKMQEAIRRLPYVYREAFVLRHLQGLEYVEVARIAGVSTDAIRVRAYRAREMLRRDLSPLVDTFWRELAGREKAGGAP